VFFETLYRWRLHPKGAKRRAPFRTGYPQILIEEMISYCSALLSKQVRRVNPSMELTQASMLAILAFIISAMHHITNIFVTANTFQYVN
jgi:hypothetical protein